MKTLITKKFLPIDLDTAWNFFSSPKNLNEITPPEMVFEFVGEVPDIMYPGAIIVYRLKPMLNIPITWVTEITHIEEKKFFVDEQRQGPYKLWHHEHHFQSVDNGVMMTDILHYDIGKSVFGAIAGWLFVHKKVAGIFEYRSVKLEKLFPVTAM